MERVSIDDLKFDGRGLIPAIVADADTGRVLTLAWMNRESLGISLERGLTCFWSRSRQKLWLKGEESGNFQRIVSVTADCDRDALLVMARPEGPACHLGNASCFEDTLWQNPTGSGSIEPGFSDKPFVQGPTSIESPAAGACGQQRGECLASLKTNLPDERAASTDSPTAGGGFSLEGLMRLIEGRRSEKITGSYTSYLFEKGLDKILKKVGEESAEVIIAAKAEDKGETVYELADLAYHLLVLMVQAGISLEDVMAELASRHVIDSKVKQERMTS